MKIVRTQFLAALFLLTFIFSDIPLGVTEEVSMNVNGMVCAVCAKGVTKTLESIEGVQDVQVNIEGQQVVVILKDGATVDNAALEDAVKKAGFSVVSIQRGATPKEG